MAYYLYKNKGILKDNNEKPGGEKIPSPVKNESWKPTETTGSFLKQVAFMMFSITNSVPVELNYIYRE